MAPYRRPYRKHKENLDSLVPEVLEDFFLRASFGTFTTRLHHFMDMFKNRSRQIFDLETYF